MTAGAEKTLFCVTRTVTGGGQMDAMQDLGERIRRVRGYTSQEAFARQLGISKGALGCYERGVNCPNVEVILNISRLCHVSLEWLMTGKGNMADTRAPEGPVAGSHAAVYAVARGKDRVRQCHRSGCALFRTLRPQVFAAQRP